MLPEWNRVGRWWPVPALVLTGMLAWMYLRVDRRPEVAMALLFRGDSLDARAVGSALSARFPPGSVAQELEQFANQLGGRCATVPAVPLQGTAASTSLSVTEKAIYCQINLRSTLCVGTWLELKAELRRSGTVAALSATESTRAC